MNNLEGNGISSQSLASAGVNYNDLSSLNDIKRAGREKDPESLRKVAEQFESMFVQMMLKTMRETNEVFGKDNPLNSSESKHYQQMLDSQLSLSLSSGRGMGIADSLFKQLNRQHQFGEAGEAKDPSQLGSLTAVGSMKAKETAEFNLNQASQALAGKGQINWQQIVSRSSHNGTDLADPNRTKPYVRQAIATGATSDVDAPIPSDKKSMTQSIDDFIKQLAPAAKRVASYLGVDPKAIVAQAALETGWGQHVIHDDKGQSSFNMFNIKASRDEASVEVDTIEYRGGLPNKERASFKTYNSLQESVVDYGRLLKNSPRYQQALEQGDDSQGFVEKLQAAGYATDPEYANKIKTIMQRSEFSQLQTKPSSKP